MLCASPLSVMSITERSPLPMRLPSSEQAPNTTHSTLLLYEIRKNRSLVLADESPANISRPFTPLLSARSHASPPETIEPFFAFKPINPYTLLQRLFIILYSMPALNLHAAAATAPHHFAEAQPYHFAEAQPQLFADLPLFLNPIARKSHITQK